MSYLDFASGAAHQEMMDDFVSGQKAKRAEKAMSNLADVIAQRVGAMQARISQLEMDLKVQTAATANAHQQLNETNQRWSQELEETNQRWSQDVAELTAESRLVMILMMEADLLELKPTEHRRFSDVSLRDNRDSFREIITNYDLKRLAGEITGEDVTRFAISEFDRTYGDGSAQAVFDARANKEKAEVARNEA